jgi:hypothetical protein
MSHLPVNHPLRPLYRVLAAASGSYVLAFGVAGLIEAGGTSWFGRGETIALGLRTNLAFALASVVAGGVILFAGLIGRNLDSWVNLLGGVVFLVAGTAMMALINTDLNVLNFAIETVIVSFVIGMVLLAAGLYGRSAPRAANA